MGIWTRENMMDYVCQECYGKELASYLRNYSFWRDVLTMTLGNEIVLFTLVKIEECKNCNPKRAK